MKSKGLLSDLEPIVGGIQQPAAEARPVRRHHRNIKRVQIESKNADPPGAGYENIGLAVGGKVSETVEMVVRGIEKPTAETGAVRRHHRNGERASRKLEYPDAPGARDHDFRFSISIQISGRYHLVVERIEEPAAETGAVGRHHRGGQRAS